MSRIGDLIRELCPQGVEFQALGEIGELVRGNGMPKSDFVDSGVGCIHYGQIYTYYRTWTKTTISFVPPEKATKLAKVDPGDLIITNTSENLDDVCKAVAWLGDEQIVTGGHATVMKHDQDPKYLAYYLQTAHFQAEKRRFASGTKVIDVSARSLAKIRIPVPPLDVQRAIVRVLDLFESLEAELEAELETRRQQYVHYRDTLLRRTIPEQVPWIELGSLGPVRMCKRIYKAETSQAGEVPFFKIGTFGGQPDAYISRETFEKYSKDYPFPKLGDVLISAAGTIGRTVEYDGRPAYFQDSNIVWIDNDETIVRNRYLRYQMQCIRWETDSGTIKRLYNENLRRTRIPAPSLAEQDRIVASLDQFDALLTSRSVGLPAEMVARRKQYEYYRDKLLSFEEAA